MSTEWLIFSSFGLNFGLPMAWAVRELIITRPLPRGGQPDEYIEPDPAPLPTPLTQKPLPDCLIPKPMKVRDLELV